MINAMEVREDDEEFKNAVDLMFDELKERGPRPLWPCGSMAKYKAGGGQNCQEHTGELRRTAGPI